MPAIRILFFGTNCLDSYIRSIDLLFGAYLMTITDFSTLTITEQLELLQTKGVYLSKRKSYGNTVILYQFNELYVEIFYKKYRQVIDHVHCFCTMDHLDPYLGGININDVFKK
jgi:hypothetical protein